MLQYITATTILSLLLFVFRVYQFNYIFICCEKKYSDINLIKVVNDYKYPFVSLPITNLLILVVQVVIMFYKDKHYNRPFIYNTNKQTRCY